MSEPVVRKIRVRCPLGHAFDVFTARLDLWWPKSHRRFERSALHLEAALGGRFYERADSGEEVELGQVVRCEPPHRITYTWRPGAVKGPTEVDVRFAADGENTWVEVVHAEGQSDLGALWNERCSLFERAWDQVLPAFVEFAVRASGDAGSAELSPPGSPPTER